MTTPTQAKTVDEIVERLAAPFPLSVLEWKPEAVSRDKKKALAVPYVDARAVMDRLDEVVGVFNWQSNHVGIGTKDSAGIGIRHPETGEWIWKYDLGHVEGGDAKGVKGTASDAIKRAGVQWKIARYLYAFPQQWLAWDDEDKRFTQLPQVPAWAMPAVISQPRTTTGTSTGATNGNGNGRGKMSDEQRTKLIALYCEIHKSDEPTALRELETMFKSQFQHGGKEASYNEAAALIGQLLAKQGEQTDKKTTKAKK